jgi:hypothetical protein
VRLSSVLTVATAAIRVALRFGLEANCDGLLASTATKLLDIVKQSNIASLVFLCLMFAVEFLDRSVWFSTLLQWICDTDESAQHIEKSHGVLAEVLPILDAVPCLDLAA